MSSSEHLHTGNNVPSHGVGNSHESDPDSETNEPPGFDLEEISLRLEHMRTELKELSELYPQVVDRGTVQDAVVNTPDTPTVTIVSGAEGGPYRVDVQSPRHCPSTTGQPAAGSTRQKSVHRKVRPLSRRRTQRETDRDSSSELDQGIDRRQNSSQKKVTIVEDSDDSDGMKQSVEYLGERIPTLRPRSYDGSTSWNDYQLHFDSVAQGNGWSSATKLAQLKHSLKGEAEYAVNSTGKWLSYKGLVGELERLYGPRREDAVRVAAEIRQRKLKPNESLNSLAHDIRRDVNLAYASKSPADRELDCVEIFRQAMTDFEIVKELLKTRPTTLTEAVESARRIESLQEAARLITGNVKRARVVREHDPRGSKKVYTKICTNCKEEGHYYSDCPNPAPCRHCKSLDHETRKCPTAPNCGRCGQRGHEKQRCHTCLVCGRWGHNAKSCRMVKPSHDDQGEQDSNE